LHGNLLNNGLKKDELRVEIHGKLQGIVEIHWDSAFKILRDLHRDLKVSAVFELCKIFREISIIKLN
jgi:hypothetical protein